MHERLLDFSRHHKTYNLFRSNLPNVAVCLASVYFFEYKSVSVLLPKSQLRSIVRQLSCTIVFNSFYDSRLVVSARQTSVLCLHFCIGSKTLLFNISSKRVPENCSLGRVVQKKNKTKQKTKKKEHRQVEDRSCLELTLFRNVHRHDMHN